MLDLTLDMQNNIQGGDLIDLAFPYVRDKQIGRHHNRQRTRRSRSALARMANKIYPPKGPSVTVDVHWEDPDNRVVSQIVRVHTHRRRLESCVARGERHSRRSGVHAQKAIRRARNHTERHLVSQASAEVGQSQETQHDEDYCRPDFRMVERVPSERYAASNNGRKCNCRADTIKSTRRQP